MLKKWTYKMADLCDDCPFSTSGKGLRLRKSLATGRWKEITDGLLAGEHFFCHKTTYGDDTSESDDDRYVPGQRDRLCAGAIRWQAEHGVVADAVQIIERLKAIDAAKNNQPNHKEES